MWRTTNRGVYGQRATPAKAPPTMGSMTTATPDQPVSSPRTQRVSGRVGGIAESATLKVDAKAKSLKAEGRPVIGFGAGTRLRDP